MVCVGVFVFVCDSVWLLIASLRDCLFDLMCLCVFFVVYRLVLSGVVFARVSL